MVNKTTPKTTAPKTTAPKTTKAKKVKAAAPAPAPAPAPETVSTEPVNEVVEPVDGLSVEFAGFLRDLQMVSTQLSSLKSTFRSLEKSVTKELKAAQKLKKKKQSSNRKPSGFVKPTRISKELADFLNRQHGSEVARTEVTREINKYIRANNLQDKDNGRIINADKALSELLKVQKTDELTYFNLQKFMSPHFLKAGQEITAIF